MFECGSHLLDGVVMLLVIKVAVDLRQTIQLPTLDPLLLGT